MQTHSPSHQKVGSRISDMLIPWTGKVFLEQTHRVDQNVGPRIASKIGSRDIEQLSVTHSPV